MFNQAEYVALGVRQGIEPTLAVVNDDDDVVAAAVLDRLAGAFLEISSTAAQATFSLSSSSSAFSIDSPRSSVRVFAPELLGARPGGREEQGRTKARMATWQLCRAVAIVASRGGSFPCLAPHASGTPALFLRLVLLTASDATAGPRTSASIVPRFEHDGEPGNENNFGCLGREVAAEYRHAILLDHFMMVD